MAHPRPRPRARVAIGKLLARNDPVVASAPRKSNYSSTAALERPRDPYPLIWKPRLSGPHLALVGAGGA